MDTINRYVANFMKNHKENIRFSMTLSELFDAVHLAEAGKPAQAISDTFSYGYAKGYRAAMAEMKKKGR